MKKFALMFLVLLSGCTPQSANRWTVTSHEGEIFMYNQQDGETWIYKSYPNYKEPVWEKIGFQDVWTTSKERHSSIDVKEVPSFDYSIFRTPAMPDKDSPQLDKTDKKIVKTENNKKGKTTFVFSPPPSFKTGAF